eukprot:6213558-Pleurochrysis_carterae.AAC.4
MSGVSCASRCSPAQLLSLPLVAFLAFPRCLPMCCAPRACEHYCECVRECGSARVRACVRLRLRVLPTVDNDDDDDAVAERALRAYAERAALLRYGLLRGCAAAAAAGAGGAGAGAGIGGGAGGGAGGGSGAGGGAGGARLLFSESSCRARAIRRQLWQLSLQEGIVTQRLRAAGAAVPDNGSSFGGSDFSARSCPGFGSKSGGLGGGRTADVGSFGRKVGTGSGGKADGVGGKAG